MTKYSIGYILLFCLCLIWGFQFFYMDEYANSDDSYHVEKAETIVDDTYHGEIPNIFNDEPVSRTINALHPDEDTLYYYNDEDLYFIEVYYHIGGVPGDTPDSTRIVDIGGLAYEIWNSDTISINVNYDTFTLYEAIDSVKKEARNENL